MSNVVPLGVDTVVDLPPENVLQGAAKANLADVLVLGFNAHGELYTASTHSDIGGLLLLMEMAKQRLLSIALEQAPQPSGPPAPILPFPGNAA